VYPKYIAQGGLEKEHQMDTIARIAKLFSITEVEAVIISKGFDLDWANITDEELVSILGA
jgi:hypothetical protein